MGVNFYTAMPIAFDDAIGRFEVSGRVFVRDPRRSFLYGHKEILSLDESCFTQVGRLGVGDPNLSEADKHEDPYATIFFFKCGGRPRIEAWRFLRMLGDILGSEIMTEYWEPLSEPGRCGEGDGWSVQQTLNLTDLEIETARGELGLDMEKAREP